MIDPHDNAGFSLIEIMISIAIIAIGLFAVMSVLIIVVKGNAHSNKSTTAMTLAQDKLEDLRNMDYDQITGTYTIYNNPDYYLEATVDNDTPIVNTKTVSVSVYWNPGTSTSVHKVQLNTIIAQ
ncbi:prepilin-type N-terminal cleavage/methylation domain-containing protein [Candidatus Kuenenia sp.]|uniref:prepilin-type N-terminal cleavage/methylation domain-containing protein n=1 Tax=Candidatus Kuenenia sp. TaxID=2499824 RepID=UPI00321FF97C